jgi:transcription antitermination factor NusG
MEKHPAKWFVLLTKPKNELKVASLLTAKQLPVFAPTRTEVRQWSDRKKKVLVPLLPSMVLVHLTEQEVPCVFSIPGVVRYLFSNGKRATVPPHEIEAIQAYHSSVCHGEVSPPLVGEIITVPQLLQPAEVLAVQGKKYIARLQQLGATISFQLS